MGPTRLSRETSAGGGGGSRCSQTGGFGSQYVPSISGTPAPCCVPPPPPPSLKPCLTPCLRQEVRPGVISRQSYRLLHRQWHPSAHPPPPQSLQGTGERLALVLVTAPDQIWKGGPVGCGLRQASRHSPLGPEPVPPCPSVSSMGADGKQDQPGVDPLKGRCSALGRWAGPLEWSAVPSVYRHAGSCAGGGWCCSGTRRAWCGQGRCGVAGCVGVAQAGMAVGPLAKRRKLGVVVLYAEGTSSPSLAPLTPLVATPGRLIRHPPPRLHPPPRTP